MNCNNIIFYNLSDDFTLVDTYMLQGVIDDSRSSMTREYRIYKTYAMDNPVFRENRFANQNMSFTVFLEGDVDDKYFDIKNILSKRQVLQYKDKLYDYALESLGEIEYITEEYGQFTLDFNVGMAYNIIELVGGNTFTAENNIDEYYLEVDQRTNIGGFDKLIRFNKAGSINSLENLGWQNIDNYSIPERLVEVKGDSKNVKLDTNVKLFRFKKYR